MFRTLYLRSAATDLESSVGNVERVFFEDYSRFSCPADDRAPSKKEVIRIGFSILTPENFFERHNNRADILSKLNSNFSNFSREIRALGKYL